MITGEIKTTVDRIWETFWTGGITNPLSVIEQFTYLLFIKGLDEKQAESEEVSAHFGGDVITIFPEDKAHLRWSNFKHLGAEEMFALFTDQTGGVFHFIKNLHDNKESAFATYMEDALFMIPTPAMLQKIVTAIDTIQMTGTDVKGDLYEYLLSKVATSGTNGQFRTPRHIIDMMVALMKPTPQDTILDPAAGTSGFLVASTAYLNKEHPNLFADEKLAAHFNNDMFYGFDMDRTMLRIGAMNMMLHGVENPNIQYRDSLSKENAERESVSLILANPPFKGSLDYDGVAPDLLAVTKTKKTELLFLALMLKMLKTGGRCAVVVPDGVLFGSSQAHKAIRTEIVESHQLQGVISMPSGVFKPYAGVSTAILIFTKTGTGGTDQVWFYDMRNDGYSLDDKRTPVEGSDIPDILARFGSTDESARKRTEQSFLVPKSEIQSNDYDLSINRYKEIVYEEVVYDPPAEIIARVMTMEADIQKGLKELQELVK